MRQPWPISSQLDALTRRLLFVSTYGHDVGFFCFGPDASEETDATGQLLEDAGHTGIKTRGLKDLYGNAQVIQDLAKRQGDGPEHLAKFVRATHGFRGGQFFNTVVRQTYANEVGVPLSLEELRAYIEILQSHQSTARLPERGEYATANSRYSLRFLAAVLRIADECDMSRHRLPPAELVEAVREQSVRGQKTASVALQEYEKMSSIEFVHIDHFNRVIRVFHVPDVDEGRLKLVNEVRKHIAANLKECNQALMEHRLQINDVIVEPAPQFDAAPVGPAVVNVQTKSDATVRQADQTTPSARSRERTPVEEDTSSVLVPDESVEKTKRHVFLSYCHDNKEEVTQLREQLAAMGEEVWWDEDILPGQNWKMAIREAMHDAYAVIAVFSKETDERKQSGMFPELRDAIDAYRVYPPGSIFLIPAPRQNLWGSYM